MDLKLINITASDIPDAWHQCIFKILDDGDRYVVQHGSFVGQTRLEFDNITIFIKYPYAEPYDLMLPQIPIALGIPNPVDDGYIEQYMPYLMTSEKEKDEDYTYGERLNYLPYYCNYPQLSDRSQIEFWIKVLKDTPNTNQAILQIARPEDCHLPDPPCLRHIDMRIKDDTLIFYPYFRSWDLWGGLPANLGGIAVLQKYMADEIGVKSGPIVASSKGLHIYGYVEDLARIRSYREGEKFVEHNRNRFF